MRTEHCVFFFRCIAHLLQEHFDNISSKYCYLLRQIFIDRFYYFLIKPISTIFSNPWFARFLQSFGLLTCFSKRSRSKVVECIMCNTEDTVMSPMPSAIHERISGISEKNGVFSPEPFARSLQVISSIRNAPSSSRKSTVSPSSATSAISLRCGL